jgi:NAD(P)-dependent dehydrogenase (short-subunit alcohol dehydrogenase family)
LITGGVGGLGLKIAEVLFDAAQARLVLTSRWQTPPKEQWPARAAENDKIGRALRRVLELEARGAEVLIVTTNVADIESLTDAVATAESLFGKINGVVHAAGINTDGAALSTVRKTAEYAFEAKVHGAFNLEKIFAQSLLDFFVYFSSQATYYPAPGQVVYTASNSVLDILAHRRSKERRGLTFAVGWGAWEEVGMAAVRAADLSRDRLESSWGKHDLPVSGKLEHPLIQTRHEGSDGHVIYRGMLRDGEHWVCEHRFKGRWLVSGVTILECVRATFIDLLGADAPVEFSQIGFLRPLFVDDYGVAIEIEYTLVGDTQRFEVRSRVLALKENWIVNTTGSAAVSRSQPVADATIVPNDLSGDETVRDQSGHISVGQRWNCIKGVRIEGDTTWARVRLTNDYVPDLDSYNLHPALFDRALHIPTLRYCSDGVPYTMDKIRIYGSLSAEIFSLAHAESLAVPKLSM